MQPNKSKRWIVQDRIDEATSAELNTYPPVLRQLLYNRGVFTSQAAVEFLTAGLPAGSDPYGLLGMEKAVNRLRLAIEKEEPIAVYGDYDVDGVTATTLLVQVLQKLGAIAIPYIPNRFEEGYGLNNTALEDLAKKGIHLVVTVDCGVRSIPEAAFAADQGLDMIITDHHSCGDVLPQALAIINPRQPGDLYPHKDLAGVGLAYKVAQALMWPPQQTDFRADDWLDLVALGTIADMAPLTGENRYLVSRGLNQIRSGWRVGIRSLAQAARKPVEKISSRDVGFVLAPRLNAAGRLDTALSAYRLLVTSDPNEAGLLAQQLDDQNRARQELTNKMQAEAEGMILADPRECYVAYAASKEFNLGILGLAASRVMETFYRPAIVAKINGATTRASCRSIPAFNITEALDQCTDLLVMHGGHSAAAGFTVLNENRDTLIGRLEAIAAARFQDADLLQKKVCADLEVSLRDLDFELLSLLEALQPTGIGNPEAVFLSRNLLVVGKRVVGNNGAHLSLRLAEKGASPFKAIAFSMGSLAEDLPAEVDIVYTLGRDEYNGTVGLQLMIRDIRPAAG